LLWLFMYFPLLFFRSSRIFNLFLIRFCALCLERRGGRESMLDVVELPLSGRVSDERYRNGRGADRFDRRTRTIWERIDVRSTASGAWPAQLSVRGGMSDGRHRNGRTRRLWRTKGRGPISVRRATVRVANAIRRVQGTQRVELGTVGLDADVYTRPPNPGMSDLFGSFSGSSDGELAEWSESTKKTYSAWSWSLRKTLLSWVEKRLEWLLVRVVRSLLYWFHENELKFNWNRITVMWWCEMFKYG